MDISTRIDSKIEDILSSLNQADALLSVIMNIDISELRRDTALNYFWATSNIIHTAKILCESIIQK